MGSAASEAMIKYKKDAREQYLSIFAELNRRNVFTVAFAYIFVGWLVMQVGDAPGPALLLLATLIRP